MTIKANPWWLVSLLGALLAGSIIQTVIIYVDGRNRVENVIEEMTYIKDTVAADRITTESDRFIKVTTMYSEIIAVYGNKYHEKNRPQFQGFTTKQKAAVIKEWYELSALLDLPFFVLPSIGAMESSLNPLSTTTNYLGVIIEAGYLQNRVEAVIQAKWYYEQLPEEYKKRCAFIYGGQEDLLDPINATRVTAVLLWGLKLRYQNNWAWVMTTYHWGLERIDRYYQAGIAPTKEFVFNKGTLKEDVRDPFLYYWVFNAYCSQFSRFEIKVNVDHSYLVNYLEACSQLEWTFIRQWKWFQEMIELSEEIKGDKIDFEEKQREHIAKWEERMREANEEFLTAKGIITEGKFNKIRDVFKLGDMAVTDFLSEIQNEKVDKLSRVAMSGFLGLIAILTIFAFLGMVWVFILSRRWWRGRK